jgi:hypothetical protein
MTPKPIRLPRSVAYFDELSVHPLGARARPSDLVPFLRG